MFKNTTTVEVPAEEAVTLKFSYMGANRSHVAQVKAIIKNAKKHGVTVTGCSASDGFGGRSWLNLCFTGSREALASIGTALDSIRA